MRAASYATALALLALAGYVHADGRSEYDQRAASRDLAAFQALDINHDGVLERSEVAGDNAFAARFSDMDRNGDGMVTQGELALYVRSRYGVDVPGATSATMAVELADEARSQLPAKQAAGN